VAVKIRENRGEKHCTALWRFSEGRKLVANGLVENFLQFELQQKGAAASSNWLPSSQTCAKV
jgi:hypothetical protein